MLLRTPENLRALLTLDAVCDNAPYGMLVVDRELVVRYANDSACRLLGIAREDVLAQSLHDALPLWGKATRPLLERTLNKGEITHLHEYPASVQARRSEGTLYWDGAFSPIYAPAPPEAPPVGVLAHFLEVTTQVRARQEERARAVELNTLFDTITDGLTILNARGEVARINRAGEQILRGPAPVDLPLAEAGSFYTVRHVETGEPLPPEALPGARALRGETVMGHEQLVRDGTGTDIVLAVNAAPLRAPETGQIQGAVSMFRDVTQIKRLQAETAAAYARSRRIAQTLQESLLPEVPLEFDHHTMGQVFEPAWIEEADVGGDLVDFFVTGAHSSPRAHLIVADVSGKGLMAARRTALIKYTIKALATAGLGPQALVGQLNDALEHDTGFEGFVTLFYGVFQQQGHGLSYVNAGHEPGLLWQNQTRAMRLLGPTGLPLGVTSRAEGARWQVKRTYLRPTDALLLYTDGFNEATGLGARRLLGEARAQELFRDALRAPDGAQGVQHILREIHNHAGPRLRDDLALLLLRGTDIPAGTPRTTQCG